MPDQVQAQAQDDEEEKPKQEAIKKPEAKQDLTTLLDKSQCADFTRLVATITERMRKSILANFDPSATLNKDLLGDSSKSEEDRINNPDLDTGAVDIATYEAEKKKLAENEKQLSAPEVHKLKDDVLQNYDDWRKVVMKRIGEAVNLQEQAEKQIAEANKADEVTPSSSQVQPKEGSLTPSKVEHIAPKLEDVFPRVRTSLTKLPMAKRTLVLHSVLLLLISLEHYSARSRVLLLYLTSSLKIGLKTLTTEEEKVAKGLLESAQQINADEEAHGKAEASKQSKKWKMAAATAAGAAVVGVTGGMAAPMVASGVGAIMGGLGLGTTAAAGCRFPLCNPSEKVSSLI